MKKITMILILSFFTVNAWSQNGTLTDKDFRLGLTASPTLGWTNPKIGKSEGIALGFSYGLIGDFNFAQNYSFSTGLLITTINGKSTEIDPSNILAEFNPALNNAYNLKYKLQYLEIPLAIKLKTSTMDELRWYGQFGISNGFKLNADQDANGNGIIANDRDIAKYTSFYRAGLIIGGGAEFDIGKSTSFVAGLTFNNGLSNIVSDQSRKVKNSFLALNLSVLF